MSNYKTLSWMKVPFRIKKIDWIFYSDTNKSNTEGFFCRLKMLFHHDWLIGNNKEVIFNMFFFLARSAEFSHSNGNSFSKLLSGLATFDTLFLLLAITSFGLPVLSEWYSETIFLPITPIAFGLLHTFRVGSVYMLLAVTIERFYAILFPFKSFRWKKYLLPGAIIIAVTYNIPKYFELQLEVKC